MSEIRRAYEDQAKSAQGMIKGFKILGWVFVVIGVTLCVTVIGIPVGIILILAGVAIMKLLPKMLQAKFDTLAKANSEAAEIHEFNLAKARAGKQDEAAH